MVVQVWRRLMRSTRVSSFAGPGVAVRASIGADPTPSDPSLKCRRVAELLEKLRAEFTKSRACRSQDNALVEGKNGAVVRKLMGYGYIAGEHAEAIGEFYARHLNPYLNFHRPCGFATVTLDKHGKRQRRYKREDYRTPFEKLKSLERAEQYLKAGISLAELERAALVMSDTACARQMNAAKGRLLRQCKMQFPVPPPFR